MKSFFNFQMAAISLLMMGIASTSSALESTTTADSESTSQRRLSVHGGVNIANASLGEGDSNNYAGFMVGLGAETSLVPELLNLKLELNFNRLGAENNAFGGLATTRFNYLEVPLLLRARLPLSGVVPFIVVGPRLSYLLSASTNVASISVTRSDFNSLELGGYLGAGAEMDLGGIDLVVSARYLFGLTNVVDNSNAEWNNRGLQLVTGIYF